MAKHFCGLGCFRVSALSTFNYIEQTIQNLDTKRVCCHSSGPYRFKQNQILQWSRPYRNSASRQVLFRIPNGEFAKMKDRRCQHRRCMTFPNTVH
jgi:hypothetical protein